MATEAFGSPFLGVRKILMVHVDLSVAAYLYDSRAVLLAASNECASECDGDLLSECALRAAGLLQYICKQSLCIL